MRHVFSFSVILVFTSMAYGYERLLEPAPTVSVRLTGRQVATASQLLAGRGVILGNGSTSRAVRGEDGTELIWEKVSEERSRDGLLHVRYKQQIAEPGVGAVPIIGGDLMRHFRSSTLIHVEGRQLAAIPARARPAMGRDEAQARAILEAAKLPGFNPRPLNALTLRERTHRDAGTTLVFLAAGGRYRYAYSTLVTDGRGVLHTTIIDAGSGAVLAVFETNPRGNCYPTGASSSAATGYPVRDGIPLRSIRAHSAADRPSPFTYEGFYQGSPNISVVQETDDTAFRCYDWTRSYSLFPVRTVSGTPVYNDFGDGWSGRAAGDATYHTRLSMDMLSWLGRTSWNNNNADANIAVESTFLGSERDNAFFVRDSGGSELLPPGNSVGVTPPQNQLNQVAALDVIAHEWGHGVIFSSVNFDRTPVGIQLDEGFADMFGYTAEQLHHSSDGAGCERKDWNYAEDARACSTTCDGGWARSAACDDGPSGGHALHRDDDAGSNHGRGNMMGVVHMLLTNGGQNPICARAGGFANCNTLVDSLGLDRASQILYQTVAFYSLSSSDWQNIANNAVDAARNIYSDCFAFPAYDALAEQQSTFNAFTAIGYQPVTPVRACGE